MAKPKKNVLAIMLGAKPKPGEAPSEEEDPKGPMFGPEEEVEEDEPSEYGPAFAESAEAALDAIRNDDVEGFVSSLKDAIATCVEDLNSGEY